jgi:hypothetical protein
VTEPEVELYNIDVLSPRTASVVRWPDNSMVTIVIEDKERGDLGIAMSRESALELSKFLSGE